MQTLLERHQKILLKKFHTLCGKAGISEYDKREMIAAYGVESSRDLDTRDLLDLCDRIDRMMNKEAAEADKWRKRVIAAVFGWRKAMGDSTNINEVKAIACRASEAEHFNAIPLERLRSIYYAFTKKTKDLNFVDKMTADEIDFKTWVN